MYEIGSYVRYGAKGIFQIKDIVDKEDKNGHMEKWYVLHSDKEGIETSVVTPVSNEAVRHIMDKEVIERLLDEMPQLDTIWIENKALRYENFQKIIESGSMRKLAQMAKTIYLIRDEKELCGKQIAERDRVYLERAQQLLFEEISLSCDIRQEDVLDLILSKAGIL